MTCLDDRRLDYWPVDYRLSFSCKETAARATLSVVRGQVESGHGYCDRSVVIPVLCSSQFGGGGNLAGWTQTWLGRGGMLPCLMACVIVIAYAESWVGG